MATPGTQGKTITFAQPNFDTEHDESNGAPAPGSSSDDETLASPWTDPTKKDSKDDSPQLLEKVKSAPEAAMNKIRLKDADFAGPSRHMNPTSARMSVRPGGDADAGNQRRPSDPSRDFEVMWRSRDNRKGSVAVPVSPRGGNITMRMVFSSRDVGRGIRKMFTTFPYWDMAFWSGWSYTVGSALFVIDGFWAWLPIIAPSSEFTGESEYGVPLAFFFGALFYQLGAVMAYLEAINDGSFAGSAMKRLLLGHDKEAKEILDKKMSVFFHHLQPHHHHHAEDDQETRKK